MRVGRETEAKQRGACQIADELFQPSWVSILPWALQAKKSSKVIMDNFIHENRKKEFLGYVYVAHFGRMCIRGTL